MASADDIFSVRPSGGRPGAPHRPPLDLDEFAPRYFKGGIVFSRGQSGDGPGAYADIYTMRASGSNVRVQVAGAGSSFVEDVAPAAGTLLFRRDQGLWVKKIGPARAHKLSEVADNSATNSVFSSDGRKVAAFIATDEAESLSAIDVASRRGSQLAEGFALESGSTATTIGSGYHLAAGAALSPNPVLPGGSAWTPPGSSSKGPLLMGRALRRFAAV